MARAPSSMTVEFDADWRPRPRCKFTHGYTWGDRHAAFAGRDAAAHPGCGLRPVLAAGLPAGLDGRDRGARRHHQARALSAFPQQGRSDRGGAGASSELACSGSSSSAGPRRRANDRFILRRSCGMGAKPRWSGGGFTRVVVELADQRGHPARAIARKHKAAVETWLADGLSAAEVASSRDRAREVMLLMEGAMAVDADPWRPPLCQGGGAGRQRADSTANAKSIAP